MAELARKVYRMLGLLFPIIYFICTKKITLFILVIGLAIFALYDILKIMIPSLSKFYFTYLKWITKKKERKGLTGTTYLLLSFLLTVLLFEKNIAIAAMTFSVMGDAISSLIGKKFGKIKISGKRTLEGSMGFFIISLIAGLIFFYFGLELSYTIIVIGSVAATLAELLPIQIEDNLTISLVSALAMSLI